MRTRKARRKGNQSGDSGEGVELAGARCDCDNSKTRVDECNESEKARRYIYLP